MSWSFRKRKGLPWPDGDDGEAVRPAFLTHVHGGTIDMQLTVTLLEAYGIPHISEYPLNGAFGKMILGFPPGGTKIYVPETMLEDAKNILSADFTDVEHGGDFEENSSDADDTVRGFEPDTDAVDTEEEN